MPLRDRSLAPQPAALRLASRYFTQSTPYRCPDHRTQFSPCTSHEDKGGGYLIL